MMIETSISSSVEDGLFYVTEHQKQEPLSDWTPVKESWVMSPKCDVPSRSGCEEAEFFCPPLPRTVSKQSSVSVVSESPMFTFVYGRRKKQKICSSSSSAAVAHICAEGPVNSRSNGGCLSFVNSDDRSVAFNEKNGVSQVEHENVAFGKPMVPFTCSRQSHVFMHQFANGDSCVDDHGSDDVHKAIEQKTIDVDSISDNCSSSKSNMELALDSVKGKTDENSECSSISVIATEVVREDLSEKDRSLSTLRNEGNVEEVGPSRAAVNEEIGTSGSFICSRLCKICGRSENPQKMLICDNCEEAFHLRCCRPRIKNIPVDEWYCFQCVKFKQIMLKGLAARKYSSITSGISSCRDVSSIGKPTPIELMLTDNEPYRTSVRIGKGFQVEVPEWSGPIDSDVCAPAEPLEWDTLEFTDFHKLCCDESSKVSSIGNWLQCRVFKEGIEGSDGTICGKWRRAPLFEVQTDRWECFCAIHWDPHHADCSVPQELETDQVLKQLKYIEMLRPQISARRRKSQQTKNCSPKKGTDDVRNTQSKPAR